MMIYNLDMVATKYMGISTGKTKILDFQGKECIPSKIWMDNRILKRANKFTYLGYTV